MSGPERDDDVEEPYDEVVDVLGGKVYFRGYVIEDLIAEWNEGVRMADRQRTLSRYQIAFGEAFCCAQFFFGNSQIPLAPVELKAILVYLQQGEFLNTKLLNPDDFDKILRFFYRIDPSTAQ